MTGGVPNQATRQSNQNFKIDINKMFDDWIGPIDQIRSYANVNTQDTLQQILAKAGSKADVTGISRLLKIDTTVQESRCHAFFRWVGFPVVNKDQNKFYNPGFDIIVDANRSIKLADKVSIANEPIEKYNNLSNERENYVNDNLRFFSDPTSSNAGALALTSGGTDALRKFVAPLEKSSGPFDVETDHQSYAANLDSRVGNKKVSLTDYQDSNGITPLSEIIVTKHKHIIAPFIVDARLDFCVSPQSKLMAVPFLPDNSFAKVSGTEDARYPCLLERIIRERLSVTDPTLTAGTTVQDALDLIKSVPAIKDPDLVSKAQHYATTDPERFISAVNTIRAMMKLLDKSVKYIRKVQGIYYWIPAPSTTGPEGGSQVQGVFLPTVINKDLLVTSADFDIVQSKAKGTIGNNNPNVASVDGTPDRGNFAQKLDQVDFSSKTSDSQGDNNAKNTETLSQVRKREMEAASNALRTVEIIMGEFSGFGLCDIVAIVSSLNLISKSSLVGFLDKDAYQRMQDFFPESQGVTQNDLTTSMGELTDTVKDFYNLMDKIYEDTRKNNNNS
jgi:hypothetical protein